MTIAARTLTALGSFLTSAVLCAGIAYATCNASQPQATTFEGRHVNEGFGANDSGVHSGANHNGLDLRTRDNPNVTSGFAGTVTAGVVGGYGNVVTVTNGNIRARYAHAGTLGVTTGQTVSAGQSLGDWSTTSGHSTGPHVHLEYEVMYDGQWKFVDPIEAQNLINSGMDPTSREFANAAVQATTDRCNMTADQLGSSRAGNGSGQAASGPICDPRIRAQVEAQVNSTVTKVNDFITSTYTPPPTLSQISNKPCASKELTRITNQFAYAPSRYGQQITSQLITAGGPISGIMQNLFKAEFSSINSAASSLAGMLNFQSMASGVLGDLMSSLGLSGAFSSEMCGLMVDMLLKYIQCENPIKLPSLGNLLGSLNNLIPNNCAGQALKSTLYAAGNSSALKSLNQPISASNGRMSLGTAPQ